MSSFEVRDLVWCHGSRLWSLCRDLRSVSCEVLGVSFVVAHWSVVLFGLVFFDFFKFAESRIHVVQSGILRELRVTRSCIYAIQSDLLKFDSLLRLLPWMNCFFLVCIGYALCAWMCRKMHARGAWSILVEHEECSESMSMLGVQGPCSRASGCAVTCLNVYFFVFLGIWFHTRCLGHGTIFLPL